MLDGNRSIRFASSAVSIALRGKEVVEAAVGGVSVYYRCAAGKREEHSCRPGALLFLPVLVPAEGGKDVPLVSESNTDRCFPRRDEKRRVRRKKDKNNGELAFLTHETRWNPSISFLLAFILFAAWLGSWPSLRDEWLLVRAGSGNKHYYGVWSIYIVGGRNLGSSETWPSAPVQRRRRKRENAMLAEIHHNPLPPIPPRPLRRKDCTPDLYQSDDEGIVASQEDIVSLTRAIDISERTA
nr:uncharacterized protein LOC129387808 [Dermacentor andersoni]